MRLLRSAYFLLLVVPLLGAARDCGGSDEPAILGDADAGMDLGASPFDAGHVDVDSGEPAIDMGAALVDMGIPTTDMGTPREFVVRGIASTDTDSSIVIKIGPDGDPRIVHYGEAGIVYYMRATDGVWPAENTTLDQEPRFGVGCDMYVSAAVDGDNVTHVAYRYIPGECDSGPQQNDTEVRYVTINGSTVSTPISLGTATGTTSDGYMEVAPGLAVDADNVAHVVYRENTSEPATLMYVMVAGGVATAPVAIPDSVSGRGGMYSSATGSAARGALVPGVDSHGTLYVLSEGYSGHNVRVLRKNAGGWLTPIELPTDEILSTATVANDDVVHIVTETHYYTVDAAGTVVTQPAIPRATGCARISGIATNSSGDAAVVQVCSSAEMGKWTHYVASHDGVWSAPLRLSIPPDDEAEGFSPALAFDASDRPHVAFQGHWAARDLYYATLE